MPKRTPSRRLLSCIFLALGGMFAVTACAGHLLGRESNHLFLFAMAVCLLLSVASDPESVLRRLVFREDKPVTERSEDTRLRSG